MELDPRESQVTRLVLSVLVVLAVTAGAGSFLYFDTRQKVEDAQRDRLNGEAAAHADTVDRILEAQIKQSQMMADSVYGFQQQSTTDFEREQRIGTLLYRQHKESQFTNDIQYLDTSGELIYAGNVNGQARNLDNATLELTTTSTEVGVLPERNEILIASPTAGNRYVLVALNATSIATQLESVVGDSQTRLLAPDGTIVVSTAAADEVGTAYASGDEQPSILDRGEATGEFTARTTTLEGSSTPDGERTVVGYDRLETVEWTAASSTSPASLYAFAGTVARDLVYLIVVFGLLLVGFVGMTNYPNLRAISNLSEQARRIREGETVTIESDRRDEIGDLYHSIAEMRTALEQRLEEAEEAKQRAERAQEEAENAQARAQDAREEMEAFNQQLRSEATRYGETMSAVAQGDLTQRLDVTVEEESFETIADSFNEMMDDLEATVRESQTFATEVADAIAEMHATVQEVEAISKETTEAGEEISAEADDQLADLRSASSEMSELSATVQEIASSVETVANTARSAAEQGRTGRERASDGLTAIEEMRDRVGSVAEDVERLSAEVEQINEIVEVIGDIAEQTNMLALNASIEAARAGTGAAENGASNGSGDGFAVVADEIKTLADETATQAGDIESRVTAIQQSTDRTVREMEATSDRIEEGAETVEAALEALEEIVDEVTAADDSLQEVTDATNDQAQMAQSVVSMVEGVSESAEQTAQRAREAAEDTQAQSQAISEVSETIETLTGQAEHLQESVARFETGEN